MAELNTEICFTTFTRLAVGLLEITANHSRSLTIRIIV